MPKWFTVDNTAIADTRASCAVFGFHVQGPTGIDAIVCVEEKNGTNAPRYSPNATPRNALAPAWIASNEVHPKRKPQMGPKACLM